MKMSTLLLIFLATSSALARSVEVKNESYKDAKQAESYIQFDMKSTKLGLITTSFTGYVKNFKVDGEVVGEQLKAGAKIEFQVRDMDTDSNGRNEKMWDYCLDSKNHPFISIQLSKAVPFTGETVEVPAVLWLRGQDKSVVFKAKAGRVETGFEFDLSTELSIKGLEIPDPSIAIASVRDKIEVSGHMVVTEK